jgi:large subunit ribosomal protein L2
MKLKTIVKFNNSTRHQIKIQKNLLSKYNNIIKSLALTKKARGGRNNTGRITIRHRGSYCKRKNHVFESFYKKTGIVLNSMYNSNSNAFVHLNFDIKNNIFFKTIVNKSLYPGCFVTHKKNLKNVKIGNRSVLFTLPVGAVINSITFKNKIKYSKAAGSFSQIVEKKAKLVRIRLSSGKLFYVSNKEQATLGSIGNSIYKLTKIGKAGINRLKGKRPRVRGIAMNPVDHPHGGKSNKGIIQVTPWGVPTKNKKTSKK